MEIIKNYFFRFLIVVVFFAPFSVKANDITSDNCKNATSIVEQIICHSPNLQYLDDRMNIYYNDASHSISAKQKSTLLKEQKNWLNDRAKVCKVPLQVNFEKDKSKAAFSNNQPWPETEQCSTWGINYNEAIEFSKKIQLAIKKNDREFLSNEISYPLTVYKKTNGRIVHFYVKNKRDFFTLYGIIITEDFKRKFLAYDPSNIFCNYHGGSFSGGGIWFQGDPIKVFEINQ